MKRIDVMSKVITLVTTLSVVYALIDMKLIFLAPILTISIPYRFMKYKEEDKYVKNRKILNNLFLFNLIVFAIVIFTTRKISMDIFEIISNIFISFIYFRILALLDKKRTDIYEKPEKVYEKINLKIEALEKIYKQTEASMKNTNDEKAISSMENKLNAIRHKIDDLKKQSEFIKKQIQIKENKSDN